MKRRIVMLGTSISTRGGISSVINIYRDCGLFERWGIAYLTTHVEGRASQKTYLVIKAVLQFAYLLLTRQASLVHLHASSNASFWRKSIFILMARAARVPILFHLHGGGFIDFYRASSDTAKRLIRIMLRKTSHIVVLSDYWKREIEAIVPSVPISPINNPIVVDEKISPIESRPAGQILFLGKVCVEKGVFELVSAFTQVVKRYPHIVLHVAGDGELESLRGCIQRNNINRSVKIHGWVKGELKKRLLAQSTILVLPSYAEGMPMAMLEAMGHGLTVIATRVGAIPELLENNIDGILIEPRRVDQLCGALETLLRDPLMSQQMGVRAAQKIRDRFLPSNILPLIETVYRGLLSVSDAQPAAVDRIGGSLGQ